MNLIIEQTDLGYGAHFGLGMFGPHPPDPTVVLETNAYGYEKSSPKGVEITDNNLEDIKNKNWKKRHTVQDTDNRTGTYRDQEFQRKDVR